MRNGAATGLLWLLKKKLLLLLGIREGVVDRKIDAGSRKCVGESQRGGRGGVGVDDAGGVGSKRQHGGVGQAKHAIPLNHHVVKPNQRCVVHLPARVIG